MGYDFDLGFRPIVGQAVELSDGLRVVTAGNASPMTFTGTNTYLVGTGEIAVIDPGPADEAHLAALLKAVRGQKVSHILVTHAHVDHSALAARLGQIVNAPVYAFGDCFAGQSAVMAQLDGLRGGEGLDQSFKPDVLVADGDVINGADWQVEVLHTPGHLSNHVCFASGDALFSGDHVMGWASSLISPPDGDLTQFMDSLVKLQGRSEAIYYPGHGGPVANPQTLVQHLWDHRKQRESQTLACLDGKTADEITALLYNDINPKLLPMAARNVLAHLIDLSTRDLATPKGAISSSAKFYLK